jgi:hypothetical protein
MLMSLQQHVSEFSAVLTKPSLEKRSLFVKKLKQSTKIPPLLAIDIYRNNTRGSRVKALKVIYPACNNILGDDTFYSIAKAFVDVDGKGISDLNDYGMEFDQYLTLIIKAGRLSVEYDYLPDLSRLEYRVHVAYYADDDSKFDFELFENKMQKGKQIFFRVSEFLSLFSFRTPIHAIWLNNCKGSGKVEGIIHAISEGQYLLVHRKENIPIVLKINKCEYRLLELFINNYSLQSVIDIIGCDVEKTLPTLISNKWLTGLK